MDTSTLFGSDPLGTFVLGLFCGFVAGILAFLLADMGATVLARRPRRLGRPIAFDDRPLAVRDQAWRARVREDVRAAVDAARMPGVRENDHRLGPWVLTDADDAFDARERERRCRFIHGLARGTEGDAVKGEKR